MVVIVKVSIPQGSVPGPFNLLSDADGYSVPFALNVSTEDLVNGYAANPPNTASVIRVQSINGCENSFDALITDQPLCDTSLIIGDQMWMACNLDVTTYSDGVTPIQQYTNQTEWANATIGAWCWYANNSANGTTYGKLYNWYATQGIWNEESKLNLSLRKKLAPTGWHVPTTAEFQTLIDYSGGSTVAGDRLQDGSGLYWPYAIDKDTNLNNFTALPGGERNSGGFTNLEDYVYFWTTSDNGSATNADAVSISSTGSLSISSSNNNKYDGYSVRCINDSPQIYPQCFDITIGTQTWSKCNLDVSRYRDGTEIPQATSSSQWSSFASSDTGAWCYVDYSIGNATVLKKLYNLHAINNTNNGGIIPPGYHIPTVQEFQTLTTYAQSILSAAGVNNVADVLKEQGTLYWSSSFNMFSVNTTKFTAFPAGEVSSGGSFSGVGFDAYFWTSTTSSGSSKQIFNISSSNVSFISGAPDEGYSIRLIKDSI